MVFWGVEQAQAEADRLRSEGEIDKAEKIEWAIEKATSDSECPWCNSPSCNGERCR